MDVIPIPNTQPGKAQREAGTRQFLICLVSSSIKSHADNRHD